MPTSREGIRPKLAQAADKFCKAIGFNSQRLAIEGPHYRYDFSENRGLEGTFPHAGRAGCYIFANDAGDILYVGKGSRHMGNRIWEPFGRQGNASEEELLPEAREWVKRHRPGVWAIAVPDEHWWLAMALEGFLIEELLPSQNKRLR
jgi:hypothetical protein